MKLSELLKNILDMDRHIKAHLNNSGQYKTRLIADQKMSFSTSVFRPDL